MPADDFGIGVIGTASGNTVDENNISGNTNGILIGAATRQTRIRQNNVVGNPGIQVSNASPEVRAVDILNLSTPGEAVIEGNVCLTAVGATCLTVKQ